MSSGDRPRRVGRLVLLRLVYPVAGGAVIAAVTVLLFWLIGRYVR